MRRAYLLLPAFLFSLAFLREVRAEDVCCSVGFNKYDLFEQYLGLASGGDGSPAFQKVTKAMARKAMADAKSTGVNYFRVGVTGFSPVQYDTPSDLDIWRSNPDAYWRLMDEMMNDLDASGIRIIPTFMWNARQFPALTKDNITELVTNPDSNSYLLLTRYISEFIGRYRNHPSILFYELTNELNLYVDLDLVTRCETTYPANNPLRKMCPVLGNVSTEQMIAFTRRLASLIRRLDPNRKISSGFGLPRPAAEHLRKKPEWSLGGPDWTLDSAADLQRNLIDIHQDLDIVSIHFYNGSQDNERLGISGHANAALLDLIKPMADAANKPLFIGEFGDINPFVYNTDLQAEDPDALFSRKVLDRIQALRIPYSAPWIWEYYRDNTYSAFNAIQKGQIFDPSFTPSTNAAIKQANINLGNSIAPPQSPDYTPPSVVLTWPLERTIMPTNQIVSAVASDNSGTVSMVEFWVDEVFQTTIFSAPYRFVLNTSSLTYGVPFHNGQGV
jgi:hypothetical protein